MCAAEYDVLEQATIAALDTDAVDATGQKLANKFLLPIIKQFPNSARAKRLSIMVHESVGELDRAAELCAELEDLCDPGIMKRLVAIRKAQGDVGKAIEALNEYLNTYQTDLAAWLELGDLFVGAGDAKSACFCFEEAILIEPHNYAHHVLYAEALHTCADYETAVNYFARALDLNGACLRAMVGLQVALSAVPERARTPRMQTLGDTVSARLSAVYAGSRLGPLAAKALGFSGAGARRT